MTKKKFLAVALVAILAITAAVGASLAYLKDTKTVTNTFTVGNVKIELLESKFHREGNDNSGDKSIPDPTQTASGMTYVTEGHKAFTDEEIKADAEKYMDEYLAVKGKNMVPGRGVAKCVYVQNTGKNDAYIRIRVLVPSKANNDFVDVKDGGIITNQWCSTSMINGEFIDGKGGGWNNAPYIDKAKVTKDGVDYDVYTFVRKEALAAGAMTEWNVWNFIGIHKDADSNDIETALRNGAIKLAEDGTMTINVLVEADAIQAEGFANAAAAFAAFDDQ